jgi:transglutaminase-like putative cysteine protease
VLVEFGEELRGLIGEIGEPGEDLLDWYARAGSYICTTFDYVKRATNVRTTVAESVRLRAGVCQDFAHVLIALCRSSAIPARYVSDYIFSGEAGPPVLCTPAGVEPTLDREIGPAWGR